MAVFPNFINTLQTTLSLLADSEANARQIAKTCVLPLTAALYVLSCISIALSPTHRQTEYICQGNWVKSLPTEQTSQRAAQSVLRQQWDAQKATINNCIQKIVEGINVFAIVSIKFARQLCKAYWCIYCHYYLIVQKPGLLAGQPKKVSVISYCKTLWDHHNVLYANWAAREQERSALTVRSACQALHLGLQTVGQIIWCRVKCKQSTAVWLHHSFLHYRAVTAVPIWLVCNVAWPALFTNDSFVRIQRRF